MSFRKTSQMTLSQVGNRACYDSGIYMKTQQGFVGVIVAIIVALGLLGGGYYLLNQTAKPTEQPSPVATSSSAQGTSKTAIAPSTTATSKNPDQNNGKVGWKLFDSKYGLSFYYPNALIFKENQTIGITYQAVFYSKDASKPEVGFFILPRRASDYADRIKLLDLLNEKYEKITVGGHQALRTIGGDYELIFVYGDKYLYDLTISAESSINSKDMFNKAVYSGKPNSLVLQYKKVTTSPPLITVETKSTEAGTKSDMYGILAAIKIFYDDNADTYGLPGKSPDTCLGVNAPSMFQKFQNSTESYYSSVTRVLQNASGSGCNVSPDGKSYAVWVTLATVDQGYWCIDSTGNSKKETTRPQSGSTKCL